MSHHIYNNESPYLKQWATTSETMSHHISNNEPPPLKQWATPSETMSHHIPNNEPNETIHLQQWATILYILLDWSFKNNMHRNSVRVLIAPSPTLPPKSTKGMQIVQICSAKFSANLPPAGGIFSRVACFWKQYISFYLCAYLRKKIVLTTSN